MNLPQWRVDRKVLLSTLCRSARSFTVVSLLAWCCNRDRRRTRSPCLLGGVLVRYIPAPRSRPTNDYCHRMIGLNLLLTCTHHRSLLGRCSLDSPSRSSTLTQASSYGMYVDAEGNLFKFSDFRSSCPRRLIQICTTYHFIRLPSLPHTSIIFYDR
jgi:hypothetical protein